MRILTVLLFAALPLFSQPSDEKDALAIVQRTFDGLAAHDVSKIRSSMLPDAMLYVVRGQGAPTGTTIEDFLSHIASIQGDLRERFTGTPKVMIHGRIAQVWGEYEFLHDGEFAHCGVDSVSLFKVAEGWKIAAIVYTAETTGCPGH
ncbi:MAG: nuclear transport factor 2 family protein [Bryobacteraceae bacterium]